MLMKKQYLLKKYHVPDILPEMIFAVLFVFVISSCTHMPIPVERIGKSSELLDGGKNQPNARDRARHTMKGIDPFEWWYFDGHLDTGETFVGVFYAPSVKTGKSTVTFSLYSPDFKKKYFRKSFPAGEMKLSTEDVDIICPAGFIRRMDDNNYHVQWNMDSIVADFKLTITAPGWMPAGQDGGNENFLDFFWNVHQARNSIEGTITQDGQTRQVKGVGYADHNWGKKPFTEITRHWVWGRIFSDEHTIIFADVDYINPSMNIARPLYIAKGDQMILGTGSPTIRQWDFVTHPVLKRHYPKQISIDFDQGGVRGHINIRFKALVEDVDLLMTTELNPLSRWVVRTFIAKPAYFRVIARYNGNIIEHGKAVPIEGECLYEIVEFE
jgi:hypothetical protein